MSEQQPQLAPDDIPGIHNLLATEFSARYIARLGSAFGKVAYPTQYDPSNPVCDYDRTSWPAAPNLSSEFMGRFVLGMMHKLKSKEIDSQIVAPFNDRTNGTRFITNGLREHPVMLINGHDMDLQAAISIFGANIAIAREGTQGSYHKRLHDMMASHGIATRGIGPIMLGHPGRGPKLPFVRLAQLIVHPHLTFPRTEQVMNSGIPEEFVDDYDNRVKLDSLAAVEQPSTHPNGLKTFWAMAPGAAPDFDGQDEHEGKRITRKVGNGTVKLVQDMGVALIPIYTTFGRGKRETKLEVGTLIPPDEVTKQTLDNTMADLAEFRRKNGEPAVYYIKELAA